MDFDQIIDFNGDDRDDGGFGRKKKSPLKSVLNISKTF
jgi:hypothetical protein